VQNAEDGGCQTLLWTKRKATLISVRGKKVRYVRRYAISRRVLSRDDALCGTSEVDELPFSASRVSQPVSLEFRQLETL